jgi:O-antigen/teichoic acid export membrane protein
LPRILRDVSLLAGGGYVSTALQLLRGLVLAKLLGPSGLGTVALVGIVLGYSLFADFGIAQAVGREIPISLGGERHHEARVWNWYAIAGRLLTGAIVGLGLVVYVLISWGNLAADVRFGLLTAAVAVSLQGLTTAQQIVFQAYQKFARAAALAVVFAAANLAAVFVLVPLWGVRGAFTGQLVAFAVTLALGRVLGGWPKYARMDINRLRHLLIVGLPLAALTFMSVNLVSIDQLMIVALLNTTALGVYALVLYTGSALYLLPGAVAGTVGPRLLKRYGQMPAVDSIRRLTWIPVDVVTAVMPLVCVVAWITVPAVIVRLLPAFSEAIAPVRIYCVGSAFLGINLAASTTLLALNKHRYNVPILLSSVVLNVLLDIVLVSWLHLGLNGIALGSTVSYFMYWMSHTALVRRFFGQSLPLAILSNLASAWPALVLAAVTCVSWLDGTLQRSSIRSELWLLVLFGIIAIVRWKWRVGVPRTISEEDTLVQGFDEAMERTPRGKGLP